MSSPQPDPVLFLHGQPGGARDWDRVSAQIGSRAVTLAIDRPGWRAGTPPTDLAGNADAALHALDTAGAERATVVGHSLGGAVAAWLAAEYPERVSRLVLAAPAANCAALVPLDYWLARPLAGELVGAPVMAGAGLALGALRVRRRVADLLEVDEPYLEATARGLRTPAAWRAFAADQRMLVRGLPELEERLARIQAPTTIVAGSADRVVPLSSARRLQETIRGSELIVLPGAGHLLTQRQASELAEIILGETYAVRRPDSA
jgi:pimeloyl-ACP methyl ester carboxylesterase